MSPFSYCNQRSISIDNCVDASEQRFDDRKEITTSGRMSEKKVYHQETFKVSFGEQFGLKQDIT